MGVITRSLSILGSMLKPKDVVLELLLLLPMVSMLESMISPFLFGTPLTWMFTSMNVTKKKVLVAMRGTYHNVYSRIFNIKRKD